VKDSLEQFCKGCNKRHSSSVWYYQQTGETTTRNWMCGLKYLVLEPQERELWKTFLI